MRYLLSFTPFARFTCQCVPSMFQGSNAFLPWTVDVFVAFHLSLSHSLSHVTCHPLILNTEPFPSFSNGNAGVSTREVFQDSWACRVVYKNNNLFRQVDFALLFTFFQLEDIYFLFDPGVRTVFPCIFCACLRAHFSVWPSSALKITLQPFAGKQWKADCFLHSVYGFCCQKGNLIILFHGKCKIT